MAEEVANAVNDSAVQDTATAEPAPVEEKQLEVVTEGPAVDARQFQTEEEGPAEDVADDTAEPEAAADTEEPQDEKPLAPKSENRFQKLANENRELKQQLAQLTAQEAQVAQEQELLNEINPETGDYFTPAEAERLARHQYLQTQQQNLAQQSSQLAVQQTQIQLANEASQVVNEVPLLREFNQDGSKNPEYNPEVAAEYNEALGDSLLYQLPDGKVYTANTLIANGINPETQVLVGAYNSPLKLAKLAAKAYQTAAVTAQIKGQKATEKMLSQADNPSSSKPAKASSKDEAQMSPEEYAKAHGLKEVWQ